MGCDGCELWPKSPAQVMTGIKTALKAPGATGDQSQADTASACAHLERLMRGRRFSDIYRSRCSLANAIPPTMLRLRETVDTVIRSQADCYAGLIGTNRAGHPGYAGCFEVPKLFPGRMREAANWPLPAADEFAAKPWLAGLPRLIFISDMGDALSAAIPFAYLDQEIIRNVTSPPGRRHLWLWLTKRPSRMARFGAWLTRRGVAWPENLVAMTTVTSARTLARVDALLEVPSRFKGLSLEPLFEPVAVPLTGIDWVIVGGGSDVLAKPFHVEWALELRKRCKAAGVAFFLKQLGKNPFFRGQPLALANRHGGNWDEWKRQWKTRQLPAGFHAASPAASSI